MFGDDLVYISSHSGIFKIFFDDPDHMLKTFAEHRRADFFGDFQDCMFQIGFKATYYLNLKLCFSFCL